MSSREQMEASTRPIISSSAVDAATRLSGEANATLIAAAPDLLEALRAILPYAHSRAEDMLEEGGEDDPLWLKADAAIGAVHDLLARIDSA